MHTITTTTNGPALHVELDDVDIDGILVFGSFYLDIHVDHETGIISVLGGEADDDIWLGGEAESFRVEGALEFHAERAIIEWLATSERGLDIVDSALEDHCITREEARVERALGL